MKLRSIALLAVLACSAVSAQAAGLYVKGQAMFNDPKQVEASSAAAFRASLKDNIAYSLALGYKFSLLRAEAEIQRYKQDGTNGSSTAGIVDVGGELKQLTGFANAFLDLPSFFGLAPYVGGGLGLAQVDFDNFVASQGATNIVQFSGDDTAFAYQIAGGLQFHFLGRATIHAGYRIVKHEDVSIRNALAAATQSVSLGENRMFEIGLAIGF